MPDLATITLEDVEILEADVAIHGVGSPPEGDIWSSDDLRNMAQAAKELEDAGEWRVSVRVGQQPLGKAKLGHSDAQKLLADSELPAAGWLTNQRVSEDGKKLLADIANVPSKVADLVKAKAYRTRSSELSSVKSQRTGKSYPWVVSGLAFLGGKMPAVRTLDEIHAMYEGDEAERRFLQVDDDGNADVEELRQAVAGLGVDLARENSETRRYSAVAKDITLDEKAQRDLAAELELEDGEELTPERLLEAVKAAKAETPDEGDGKPDGDTKPDEQPTEAERKLEARVEAAEKTAAETAEKLRLEERRYFVDDLVKGAKIEPGEREKWETRYDKDAELAREFAQDLTVKPELVREYGSDEGEGEDGDPEANERAYEADATGRLGLTKEEVI